MEEFNEQHPIYVIDPSILLTDARLLKSNFSPRMIKVIESRTELEMEFEKCRREVNLKLPSRLICIFLAEDDLDGRIMLQNMFSKQKRFLIVPARINCALRFHKADSKWIDIYEKTKDKTAIENYWKGISFDDKTTILSIY